MEGDAGTDPGKTAAEVENALGGEAAFDLENGAEGELFEIGLLVEGGEIGGRDVCWRFGDRSWFESQLRCGCQGLPGRRPRGRGRFEMEENGSARKGSRGAVRWRVRPRRNVGVGNGRGCLSAVKNGGDDGALEERRACGFDVRGRDVPRKSPGRTDETGGTDAMSASAAWVESGSGVTGFGRGVGIVNWCSFRLVPGDEFGG